MSRKSPAAKAPAKAKAISPASAAAKKVLHVGCSVYSPEKLHTTFRTPEWQEVRLDIDPNVKPDIVSDMTHMPMVKEGEFDAIWSSHNIEHLFAHQVLVALKEFFRVLKPGGFALITLPDIQEVASEVAEGRLETTLYESPAGPIMPLDVLYGYTRAIARGNVYMAHKTGFTAQTLGSKLVQAGFGDVHVKRQGFDLWAVGYKLPEGHPRRGDTMRITSSSEVRDYLDIPPKVWTPLGLKK